MNIEDTFGDNTFFDDFVDIEKERVAKSKEIKQDVEVCKQCLKDSWHHGYEICYREMGFFFCPHTSDNLLVPDNCPYLLEHTLNSKAHGA